jgi:hypothetical protein
MTIWIELDPRARCPTALAVRWRQDARGLVVAGMAGLSGFYLIWAAAVVTKDLITATTMPTNAMDATAHRTFSMVTDPPSGRAAMGFLPGRPGRCRG